MESLADEEVRRLSFSFFFRFFFFLSSARVHFRPLAFSFTPRSLTSPLVSAPLSLYPSRAQAASDAEEAEAKEVEAEFQEVRCRFLFSFFFSLSLSLFFGRW